MDQYQSAGVQNQCPLDHLTWIDRNMVDGPDRQQLIGNDAVFAVEV